MTKLEAMGYTAEQAEEIDRIARSIARTSGVPMNEATQAICSVMRALPPPGDAEIAMIRDNPSLNIFQKGCLLDDNLPETWEIERIKKENNA